MSKKNHNALKIALVFTGNVIGAGFATGAEISRFFVRYGKFSIIGMLFCCIAFTLVCRIVLLKIYATGADNFTDYFINIKGIKFIITGYLWAVLAVMYSAGGAVFVRYGLPRVLGTWCTALICAVVLLSGADGFVRVNEILTPVMIAGIILTGASVFIPVFSYHYVSSPVLYTSYNMITAVPVLTAVSDYADSRKTAVKASYLGGAFITLTAVSLWFLLYFYGDLNAELPVLSVLSGFHRVIYTVILYIAVLTTAVGAGIGIVKNRKRRYVLLLLLPVFFAQNAELTTLVGRLYSAFGCAGIFVLVITVIDGFKYLRKKEQKRENKRKILYL